MITCVYCGNDFEPVIVGAEYKPRAKCPHCGLTNGIKTWDTTDGRQYAPYRMGRGGVRKVTVTMRLPRDVVAWLRSLPNYNESAGKLLTDAMNEDM